MQQFTREEEWFMAVRGQTLPVIERLIREGINVNLRDNTHYRALAALHIASYNGFVDVLNILLNAKNIDIDISDTLNHTALHFALINGHTECVNMLLKAGANPNLESNDGTTAIDMSIFFNIKLTINRDINRNECSATTRNLELTKKFLRVWAMQDQPLRGSPLLNCAFSYQYVKLFLKLCANPNCFDNASGSPLHMAIQDPRSVKLLLKAGTDPNCRVEPLGRTPLVRAIYEDCKGSVKILKQYSGITPQRIAYSKMIVYWCLARGKCGPQLYHWAIKNMLRKAVLNIKERKPSSWDSFSKCIII